MSASKLFALAACMSVAASAANAQSPLTEHNVSMGMAQAIIAGTIEKCTNDGYKVSVVIVDKATAAWGFVSLSPLDLTRGQ